MWKIRAPVPKPADAHLVFIAGREVLGVLRSGHAVPHLSQPLAPLKAAQTINLGLGYRQTDTRTQNWPSRSAAKPHRAGGTGALALVLLMGRMRPRARWGPGKALADPTRPELGLQRAPSARHRPGAPSCAVGWPGISEIKLPILYLEIKKLCSLFFPFALEPRAHRTRCCQTPSPAATRIPARLCRGAGALTSHLRVAQSAVQSPWVLVRGVCSAQRPPAVLHRWSKEGIPMER